MSVGDNEKNVRENRERLACRAGLSDPSGWQFLDQVHGGEVIEVDRPNKKMAVRSGDAAVTATAGQVLAVLTADCAPVAIVGDSAFAVVHAGWKGLLAGVVANSVNTLRSRGVNIRQAVLGPCIHPVNYEFGLDDLKLLAKTLGNEVIGATSSGAPALDLPSAVRSALVAARVESFSDVGICTASSADHFSFRRDGVTGRQALVAVME